MCGRFQFVPKSSTVFVEDWGLEGGEDLLAMGQRYNLAPSQAIPVVLGDGGQRRFQPMRWGLVPGWAREGKASQGFINARVETAREKPSFRDAWRRGRRCLVMATGYYEWERKGGPPTLLQAEDGLPFAMAGLWEPGRGEAVALDRSAGEEVRAGPTCAILTTEAAVEIEDLHPRMPVLLRADQAQAWLADGVPGQAFEAEPPLAFPLTTCLVSRRLNKVGNDDPRCMVVDPQDGPPPPGLFDEIEPA